MVEYSVKYSHNYTHYSNEWKDCLRFVIVCNELIEEKLQIMISMFNSIIETMNFIRNIIING